MKNFVKNRFSALLLGLGMALACPIGLHAEENMVRPLLLEEGGNLGFFDPGSMTLLVQGKVYRIDPQITQVQTKSSQGSRLTTASQISDLPERLAKLRGYPLSFKSRPDGVLELIVLDEQLKSASLAP
ncbi:hypothetical protein [Thiofaba sp. EF100]|uniref:hypothetical protein n=1 Tax=Thiofaba sp. EF100 TaxID=3121274 RepID=UPI0032216470